MADEPKTDVKEDPILAVLQEDEEQASTKESSPEEKKPEAPESKEKEESKEEPESKEEESAPAESEEEEAKPSDPEEEAEEPKGKADERKAQLNSEIRDLVAKRNVLKEEVTKANSEAYQTQTKDELVEEGMTELEAKVEEMRQQQEMDKYNTAVAEARLTINSEAERVIQDFPIFNQESDQYDKDLAEEAAELLDANLIRDEHTGMVIGSNISPYQLYKTLDRANKSSTVKGQIQGREDTEKMLANADATSNAAPPVKKKDPVLDILASDDD